MARTSAQVSADIRARLRVIDPDISAEPLTVERKIIDTVADAIAGVELDQYVIDYQYDIDTKVGLDLDKFIALFGFARQGGVRATGFVTFSRATASTTDVFIPGGTQVVKPASAVTPVVTFVTTTGVTLYAGSLSVDAPIEASVTGLFGNVPAGSITTFGASGSSDFSGITNGAATSGGSEIETDTELRLRFKNTIFRNVAGTDNQYLAIAIASKFANKAKVVGPTSRFIEYLQITGGAAISQIPFSKYTYPFDYYLTDGNIVSEHFYTARGVDYTFNVTVPPSITVTNPTNLPDGAIVLLEHSYCSVNSRNNPAGSVANYVDVYVSGDNEDVAVESCAFPSSVTNTISASTASVYYQGNFVRADTSTPPLTTSVFQELLWQPATGLPSAISIGVYTFYLGTDYWLVRDTSTYKGSRRARNGIEWSVGTVSVIAASTPFQIQYNFNKLPITLNELMEDHKQITTDVLVHAATNRYLVVSLVVMYNAGYSRVAVDAAIESTLSNFLERQDFGAVIQLSDLVEIAHEVPGVDNVRIATSADGNTYGVQEFAANGITPVSIPKTNDFALQDSDLPVLQKVVTTQRSQNTWSS